MRGCLSYEARAEKSCMLGKISIMQVLLTTDVDPNKIVHLFIDCKGSTKLHRTSDYNEAKELLESGADVNKKNGWGETPLHLAVFEGKGYSFIKLLLDYGADVNACSNLGRRPLHCALKAGLNADKEIINLLVRYGAEIDDNGHAFFSLSVSSYLTQRLYDQGDITLTKFLIKITLLYGFSDSYCETIASVFCDKKSYCPEIGQFTKICIREVLMLRAEYICDNLTWFDITTSEPEELKLVPVKLQNYFPRRYRVYHNIIKNSCKNYMRRVTLFEVLKHAEMVIVSEISNKKIVLDYHCLSIICGNLINNDTENFVKALYDEQTLNQMFNLTHNNINNLQYLK